MGEKPSNQPLLDYLAVRFMEQGWSTKKLIRELVLSRTYRLSTATSLRNEKIDPGNVLPVARQSRAARSGADPRFSADDRRQPRPEPARRFSRHELPP